MSSPSPLPGAPSSTSTGTRRAPEHLGTVRSQLYPSFSQQGRPSARIRSGSLSARPVFLPRGTDDLTDIPFLRGAAFDSDAASSLPYEERNAYPLPILGGHAHRRDHRLLEGATYPSSLPRLHTGAADGDDMHFASPAGWWDKLRAMLFRRRGYESLLPDDHAEAEPSAGSSCLSSLPSKTAEHASHVLLRVLLSSLLLGSLWLIYQTTWQQSKMRGYDLYASLSPEQAHRLFGAQAQIQFADDGRRPDAVGLAAPVTLHDPYRSATLSFGFELDPEPQPRDTLHDDWVPTWYPPNLNTNEGGEEDSERAAGSSLTGIAIQEPLTSNPECLEAWVARGEVCSALDKTRGGAGLKGPVVDIIFTWVNGSEMLHRQNRMYWDYCMTTDSSLAQEVCPTGYVESPRSSFRQPKKGSTGLLDSRIHDRKGARVTRLAPESEETINGKMNRFLTEVYPYLVSQSMDPSEHLRNSNQDVHRHSIGASDQRFIELDELRFAVRSAVRFLPNLHTVHIISPDFAEGILPSALQAVQDETELRNDRWPSRFLRWELSIKQVEADVRKGLNRWVPDCGGPRVGQKPRWLNFTSPYVSTSGNTRDAHSVLAANGSVGTHKQPILRLHHDWSIFRPGPFPISASNSYVSGSSDELDTIRERMAAPTFNSMAVEATFDKSNVPGLGATFFLASDDFFLLRPFTTGDVASPLHGLVMRLSDTSEVQRTLKSVSWSTGGAGPGLEVSAYILDRRFGNRTNRRSAPHVHKSMDSSLLQELRLMFREDLTAAGKARFRGLGYNLVTHTLFSSMVLERHREAVLWSFLVLRLDANADGQLDQDEWIMLLHSMGRTAPDPANASDAQRGHSGQEWPVGPRGARLPRRTTLAPRTLKDISFATGLDQPNTTEWRFSSQDGYALSLIAPEARRQWIRPPPGRYSQDIELQGGWPFFLPVRQRPPETPTQPWDHEPGEGSHKTVCTFALETCLPPQFFSNFDLSLNSSSFLGGKRVGKGWGKAKRKVSAEEAFVHIAFARPECGDCLITHLVQQSGAKGLSAALPSAGKTFPHSPPSVRNQFLPSSNGQDKQAREGASTAGIPFAKHKPQIPHLPLTRTWRPFSTGTNDTRHTPRFSAAAVAHATGWEGKSMREFALLLIQRYAYTLGSSPLKFITYTEESASRVLSEVEDDEELALLCVNDDLVSHKSQDKIDEFHALIEQRLPFNPHEVSFEVDTLAPIKVPVYR